MTPYKKRTILIIKTKGFAGFDNLPMLIHNLLKKDYEIDWFLCFFLYDAMQKTRDFYNKDFSVCGFAGFDIKIYEFLIIIPALD